MLTFALAAAGPAPSSAVPPCASRPTNARMSRLVRAARYRYSLERVGAAVHVAFRRVARDAALVRALVHDDRRGAQAAADRLLVNHIVRVRLRRGASVLLDANPHSFAVGGTLHQIHDHGRALGQLEVTIQDVVGYIKLVEKVDHALAIVGGSSGRLRASRGVGARPLPASGCTAIAGRRYAFRSFAEKGFAGERLTIWVLGAL